MVDLTVGSITPLHHAARGPPHPARCARPDRVRGSSCRAVEGRRTADFERGVCCGCDTISVHRGHSTPEKFNVTAWHHAKQPAAMDGECVLVRVTSCGWKSRRLQKHAPHLYLCDCVSVPVSCFRSPLLLLPQHSN